MYKPKTNYKNSLIVGTAAFLTSLGVLYSPNAEAAKWGVTVNLIVDTGIESLTDIGGELPTGFYAGNTFNNSVKINYQIFQRNLSDQDSTVLPNAKNFESNFEAIVFTVAAYWALQEVSKW